ncbi:hypothetical protein [Microbacterium sp.]|uniref:hypothetical protein n=1 Tax=Microbacterium sp. TaxID=51671 RepID=UPI003A8A642F
MQVDLASVLTVAAVSVALFGSLCAALVLTVLNLRTPRTVPLAVAGGLLLITALTVAILPVTVPPMIGLIAAVLAIGLAVIGGNPVTRHVLALATGGRVRETADGGILLPAARGDTAAEVEPLLRGGTTVGYLERLAVALTVVAGYPEAIAVVVAIKGIGRFSELATAEARERFIIGTLASLLWACLCAATVRLALG